MGGAITEDAKIKVTSYHLKERFGTADFAISGTVAENCHNIKIKKAVGDQKLDGDYSCLKADVEAKYCSDQDTIQVGVGVKGLPKVATTLKKVPC